MFMKCRLIAAQGTMPRMLTLTAFYDDFLHVLGTRSMTAASLPAPLEFFHPGNPWL
jgi:hypothetical protein